MPRPHPCALMCVHLIEGARDLCLHFPSDRPDEARELAGDGSDYDGQLLAALRQRAIPAAQSRLCLGGDVADRGRDAFMSIVFRPAGPRYMAVTQALPIKACRTRPLPALVMPSRTHGVACRTFTWHQAEVTHELAWGFEPSEVAYL